MSDWSDAGLPPLQMRGYTGTFVPGIKRTSFRTAHPSQTIRERRRYNGIFETFLTHSQLVAAEAFIENVGYLAFTITTVNNENYLVRLMRSPEINSMSGETYRYVIHVDITTSPLP